MKRNWNREVWGNLFRHYGMLFVLVLLGLYYSYVTISDHQATGAEAGKELAQRVKDIPDGEVQGVIVVRDTEEDGLFLQSLKDQLSGRPVRVVGEVRGDPREVRAAFDEYVAKGIKVDFIATTPECSQWSILNSVAEQHASMGNPTILVPESYRWPTFLTRQNLLNVANQISVVAILAVGMTVVIITGGIDLSVGSLIAFSAVLVTVLIERVGGGTDASVGTMVWYSVLGVLACGAVGLFSGGMVAFFKVPPFIVTLAIMQIASGLAFIIAQGTSVYNIPDSFTGLGRGVSFLGIPNAVLLMAVLYLLAHVMMSHSVLGRRIYAVGGNAEAARLSGVNVSAILLFAYAFCGAMAGLGGVVQASQLKSGAPTYGVMYELYAIAAVVVGGTSLSGGEGRVMGTLIGALIIAVIQNGMNLTGVESYQQKVVLGIVILGAVLLDLMKKKDWRKWVPFRGRSA